VKHVRRQLLTVLPLSPLLLAGCGTSSLFGRRIAVRRIAIAVADEANENAPIALDLVHVSERPPLAGTIADLSAAQWFERRAQYERDWPRDLDIRSWEVVPGQILPEERLPSPAVSSEAFLFALYHAPGTHRARLAEGGRVSVRLDVGEMRVTEQ